VVVDRLEQRRIGQGALVMVGEIVLAAPAQIRDRLAVMDRLQFAGDSLLCTEAKTGRFDRGL
jgi:hypothetical protein